jgi:hypothetical protein
MKLFYTTFHFLLHHHYIFYLLKQIYNLLISRIWPVRRTDKVSSIYIYIWITRGSKPRMNPLVVLFKEKIKKKIIKKRSVRKCKRDRYKWVNKGVRDKWVKEMIQARLTPQILHNIFLRFLFFTDNNSFVKRKKLSQNKWLFLNANQLSFTNFTF